jgi:hypothetical protein
MCRSCCVYQRFDTTSESPHLESCVLVSLHATLQYYLLPKVPYRTGALCVAQTFAFLVAGAIISQLMVPWSGTYAHLRVRYDYLMLIILFRVT